MKATAKARVFISYKWDLPWKKQGMKEPVLQLAERLRTAGLDSRVDQFYEKNLHAFETPDDWKLWAKDQIREADSVLLVCSPGYAEAGRLSSWDVTCMKEDLNSGRVELRKFIPIGFGPFEENSRYAPDSVLGNIYAGPLYYDLDCEGGFEALVRRIKGDFRKRHPRQGVFISYGHKDDQIWIKLFLRHLRPLERLGVEIWTDRDIKPGDPWHDAIQNSLERAKVAVLLVTPAFLESDYIGSDELPNLLQAAETEGLVIFWVPVRHSAYALSEINQFQAAHDPSAPLSTLDEVKRDQALVNITLKLADALGISK